MLSTSKPPTGTRLQLPKPSTLNDCKLPLRGLGAVGVCAEGRWCGVLVCMQCRALVCMQCKTSLQDDRSWACHMKPGEHMAIAALVSRPAGMNAIAVHAAFISRPDWQAARPPRANQCARTRAGARRARSLLAAPPSQSAHSVADSH
jgi:hypothetical protein